MTVEFTRLHAREGDEIHTVTLPYQTVSTVNAAGAKGATVAWLPFYLITPDSALVAWFAYAGPNGTGVFTSWDTSPEASLVVQTGAPLDSEVFEAMFPSMQPTPGLTGPPRALNILIPHANDALQRAAHAHSSRNA